MFTHHYYTPIPSIIIDFTNLLSNPRAIGSTRVDEISQVTAKIVCALYPRGEGDFMYIEYGLAMDTTQREPYIKMYRL